MKCVAARSIKSAIEFVFDHVKDTGRLAYWNLRGERCSFFCGMDTYVQRLTIGVGAGGGGQRPYYREVDRLLYVWRRRET